MCRRYYQEQDPDLLLLHLSYVDHQRHRLGVHSEELTRAFRFVDEQIGKVLEAVEEKGGIQNTNIVLLGDHGQLYCDELFHINSLFRKKGWITEENGVVKTWKFTRPSVLSVHRFICSRKWTERKFIRN